MITEEVYRRRLQAKSEFRPRMSAFWLVYESVVCLIMAGAIALQFVYIFNLSPGAPVQTRWDVYDAGTWKRREKCC